VRATQVSRPSGSRVAIRFADRSYVEIEAEGESHARLEKAADRILQDIVSGAGAPTRG